LIGDLFSPDGNNSPCIAPHTGSPALTVPMGYNTQGRCPYACCKSQEADYMCIACCLALPCACTRSNRLHYAASL
jgi:hypothetical protein